MKLFKQWLNENEEKDDIREFALKNGHKDIKGGLTAEQQYFLGFIDCEPELYKKTYNEMIDKNKKEGINQ
jgi:hypothetical protein